MRASPPTLRGYVVPDGDVLLRQAPAAYPGHWLADVLRQCADCEIIITCTIVGQGRPDWLSAAARDLERPQASARRPLPAGWGPGVALLGAGER